MTVFRVSSNDRFGFLLSGDTLHLDYVETIKNNFFTARQSKKISMSREKTENRSLLGFLQSRMASRSQKRVDVSYLTITSTLRLRGSGTSFLVGTRGLDLP